MSGLHQKLWSVGGPRSRAVRAFERLLAPAEWAYRLAVAGRNWAYDRRLWRSHASAIPALAVGNLSVGGTGKTPVAAWFAARLVARGHRPAIVMRGYGGDEVEVHRLLNPRVPVHVAPRRVTGVHRAAAQGADIAVLDDAFQHRALRASANVLLLAAEQWTDRLRLLPRGPWREDISAIERAQLVVITRKEGSAAQAERVAATISKRFPGTPVARAHIGLSSLIRYDATRGLGRQVEPRGFHCRLAIAGVARPEAVWRQLEDAGVVCDERWTFGDHHRYGRREIDEVGAVVGRGRLIATLKDAVKLVPGLPAELEVYVPIQSVIWESGESDVERLMTGLSAHRAAAAGSAT